MQAPGGRLQPVCTPRRWRVCHPSTRPHRLPGHVCRGASRRASSPALQRAQASLAVRWRASGGDCAPAPCGTRAPRYPRLRGQRHFPASGTRSPEHRRRRCRASALHTPGTAITRGLPDHRVRRRRPRGGSPHAWGSRVRHATSPLATAFSAPLPRVGDAPERSTIEQIPWATTSKPLLRCTFVQVL